MATIELVHDGHFEIQTGTPSVRWAAMTRLATNVGEIGRACTIAIQDVATGNFFNGVAAFAAAKVNIAMVEVDGPNLPGLYDYAIPYSTLALALPASPEMDLYIEVTNTNSADGAPFPAAMLLTRVRYNGLMARVDDSAIADPAVTMLDIMKALRAILTSRFELSDADKVMRYYADDDATVILEFNTTDAAGSPAVREIFDRTRTV